ncbi:MAG: hypothetical protein E7353_00305 [Clostridiales bacterium]|nr:hypothetical protein [Clostridiales bacterium]
MYKCVKGHFTNKEHDGKNCPYDNMSASELSSALVIDTEQKEREKYQAVMSGARSGALDSESKRAIAHAELIYETFRNSKVDTVKISQITGYPIEDLEKIKEYIFNNDEFLPDYDQAQTWDRLRKGNPIEADYIFLKHELLELSYRNQGYSYKKAHYLAEKEYNYAKAIKEWKDGNIKKKGSNKK